MAVPLSNREAGAGVKGLPPQTASLGCIPAGRPWGPHSLSSTAAPGALAEGLPAASASCWDAAQTQDRPSDLQQRERELPVTTKALVITEATKAILSSCLEMQR